MMQIAATVTRPHQNGSVTHHHDQVITPVNLRATNVTPKSPKIPIPPELLLDSLTIISLKKYNNCMHMENKLSHFQTNFPGTLKLLSPYQSGR